MSKRRISFSDDWEIVFADTMRDGNVESYSVPSEPYDSGLFTEEEILKHRLKWKRYNEERCVGLLQLIRICLQDNAALSEKVRQLEQRRYEVDADIETQKAEIDKIFDEISDLRVSCEFK
jgi:hypothetical protein